MDGFTGDGLTCQSITISHYIKSLSDITTTLTAREWELQGFKVECVPHSTNMQYERSKTVATVLP